MRKISFLLIIFFLFVEVIFADFGYGSCPSALNVVHVTEENFGGRWFEVKKSTKPFGKSNRYQCGFFDVSFSRNKTGNSNFGIK